MNDTPKKAKISADAVAISAADVAREVGIEPMRARKILREADIHAPYSLKDRARMIAALKAALKTHG